MVVGNKGHVKPTYLPYQNLSIKATTYIKIEDKVGHVSMGSFFFSCDPELTARELSQSCHFKHVAIYFSFEFSWLQRPKRPSNDHKIIKARCCSAL